MKDKLRTKEQPINEPGALRKVVSPRAQGKAKHKRPGGALKKLDEESRYLYAHLQAVIEAERKNIARELHDELGQMLTAMKMDISWLTKKLPRNEGSPAVQKVTEIASLVDDTILKVQRIAAELRPRILDDLGLIAALEYATDEFQQRSGIKCRLNAEPEDLALEPEIATAVFRIVQEALTNVSRHAEATLVSVTLKRKGNRLVMQLKDNGRGIREEQVASKHSLGLIGMRERASLAGGRLQIRGTPGKGTTVTLSLPLHGE